jgi:hypothetical protein
MTLAAINGHIFIRRIFLEVSPDWLASVSKNAVQVQQKLSMTRNLFVWELSKPNAARSRRE